jgi:hypothetical protein
LFDLTIFEYYKITMEKIRRKTQMGKDTGIVPGEAVA